jgi:hypothetical protein
VNPADGPGRLFLCVGIHFWRFEYDLPTDLPPSWRQTYGNCRYVVSVELESSRAFKSKQKKEKLKILSIQSNKKDVLEWHVARFDDGRLGSLDLAETTRKPVLIIGQSSFINGTIKNNSSSSKQTLEIFLVARNSYSAGFHSRSERITTVVATLNLAIPPQGEMKQDFEIKVPESAPPSVLRADDGNFQRDWDVHFRLVSSSNREIFHAFLACQVVHLGNSDARVNQRPANLEPGRLVIRVSDYDKQLGYLEGKMKGLIDESTLKFDSVVLLGESESLPVKQVEAAEDGSEEGNDNAQSTGKKKNRKKKKKRKKDKDKQLEDDT